MNRIVKNIIPGIYQHYKGHYYNVLCTAKLESNNKSMVVYKKCDLEPKNQIIYVRPLEEFAEVIIHNNIVTERFKKIDFNKTE